MMRFVPFHFLATLGEDFVRSEAVLLNDPATISNAVSAIAGGLSAAGWRVLRKEESPARTMVFLGDSKNRLRTLTTIRDAMGLAQFTNGAKDSEDFMLLLQTADDPACTGGL